MHNIEPLKVTFTVRYEECKRYQLQSAVRKSETIQSRQEKIFGCDSINLKSDRREMNPKNTEDSVTNFSTDDSIKNKNKKFHDII